MNPEFNDYVQQYSAELTRLCISLCGNKSDAEDLFQDTWMKALRHYHRYDATKPFDKWLYSICVNTYKNTLNSAFLKRRKTFENDDEERAFFNSIAQFTQDNKEDYYELHKAVLSLSKKQRIVVVLYYFKDYSVTQIAQMINIPSGTVKSRLSSARAEIKRRLTNEKKDNR